MGQNRVLETALRERARFHGPNAVMRELEALFVKDTKDLYAERINIGERAWFRKDWMRPPGLNADIQNAAESARMIVDPDFELLGTNAASTVATIDPAGGGVLLTTTTGAADSAIILPHLDASQSAWSTVVWATSKEVHWHARVRVTSATFAAQTVWGGLKLTNTPVIATDNDQVFFRYQDTVNSGTWGFQSSVGGTDATLVNSGITVETGVWYLLSILIDEGRNAYAYIDGELVAVTGALTSTNLIPYVGILNGAAAAKKLALGHGYTISRKAG